MIQPTTREAEASRNVIAFEIRELNDDVVRGESRGEQIEDVADADAHPAHTRATTAQIRIDGDAIHQRDGLAHAPHSGWDTEQSTRVRRRATPTLARVLTTKMGSAALRPHKRSA
jgi:hypothetical protein